jgi:hypothetical protein
LDIGRVHLATEQQTTSIGHSVALTPFDLLGRILPVAAAMPRRRTRSKSLNVNPNSPDRL